MEDKKDAVLGADGSLIKKIIFGAIIVIAILLAIFLWPKETKSPTQDVVANEQTAETDNGALRVLVPITEGDFEYAFTGVKWTFDTTSPEVAGTNQTWLKMEFADFTRNGNAITFGTPYKLGVHTGVCKEVENLEIDTDEEGIPFSYVVCEGNGVKKEFVVLQREKQIVIRVKEIGPSTSSEQTAEAVWKDWYEIDVTDIVR